LLIKFTNSLSVLHAAEVCVWQMQKLNFRRNVCFSGKLYHKTFWNIKRNFSSSKNDFKDWVRIILIRHGETQWNAEKKIQGAGKDIKLNHQGVDQAHRLAKRVLHHTSEFGSIQRIYSSPLLRASQTAKIISQNLGTNIPLLLAEDLKEIHFGRIEGNSHDPNDPSSSWSELVKVTQEWRKGNVDHCFEGGESLSMVRERCVKFLEAEFNNSKHQSNRQWLIVSHRGVIKTIFSQFFGQSLSDLDSIYQDNAAFNHLMYHPPSKKCEVITWNSTSHL
jgi:broad specificity phosphatase PhoE